MAPRHRGKIEQSYLEAAPRLRAPRRERRPKKDGTLVVMNRHGELVIVDDTGRERERYRLVYGADAQVTTARRAQARLVLAEWDPFATPILTEVGRSS